MNTKAPLRKLPIGIQSFEKLRQEGYVYVDKTALVYQLAVLGNPCFLSRPRRFGKSLLLSTFEAYFQGKRELFHGLAIEELEEEWTVRPVLHLSLNAEKYDSVDVLRNLLETQLGVWEELYGSKARAHPSLSVRFMSVIRRACEVSGQRVAVLIDEYDKPLLRNFHDTKLQDEFRELLTAFYTVLKDSDPYLQFVLITGVTKFAQMGIFGTLNQLQDISYTLDYNTLCGLTHDEITASFGLEINAMAEKQKDTPAGVMERMTRKYDGYRFTGDEEFTPMFNPFSVLNAFQQRTFGNFWFSSGTPTFLVDMLRQTDFDLREMDNLEVLESSLTDDRANIDNPIPMVYQSGYLTIKAYDPEFQLYTLGFPNEEVKYGFLNFAAPFYTPLSENESGFFIGKFVQELRTGDIDAFLTRLRAFFAGIPYQLNAKEERHYQTIFYIVFSLLGQYTRAEVASVRGRADAVVKTADIIYVFEFKLDGTVEEALRQIDDRGYLIPYTADGRRLVKVAVSFDQETRNLGEWCVEREEIK